MFQQHSNQVAAESHNSTAAPCGTTGQDNSQQPQGKPQTGWEQPSFEDFDLCMEVTAYVYHWQ